MITSACPHLHAGFEFGVAAAFSSFPTRFLSVHVLAFAVGNLHHLQRVLKHDGTKQLFFGECKADPTIKNSQIEKIRMHLKGQQAEDDQYRKANIGHYQPLNYKPVSPDYYLKTAIRWLEVINATRKGSQNRA